MHRPHHSRLRDFVRERLKNRPKGKTLKDIAAETGLTFKWVRSLSEDAYKECSCAKLEVLYVYFTGRELQL